MTNARKLAKQHKKARARKAKATQVRADKIVAKKAAREAEQASGPGEGAGSPTEERERPEGNSGWTRANSKPAGPPSGKVHRTQGK